MHNESSTVTRSYTSVKKKKRKKEEKTSVFFNVALRCIEARDGGSCGGHSCYNVTTNATSFFSCDLNARKQDYLISIYIYRGGFQRFYILHMRNVMVMGHRERIETNKKRCNTPRSRTIPSFFFFLIVIVVTNKFICVNIGRN